MLVYLATHALADRTELIFATQDTDAGRAWSTGLSSSVLARLLADTPARTIVLLDLCRIGDEASPRESPAPLRELRGLGTATVISAPSGLEYRIDDRSDIRPVVPADPVPFTRVVAEGLRLVMQRAG